MLLRWISVLGLALAASACSPSPVSASPDGQPPATATADTPPPASSGDSGGRPSLSAEECAAKGGTVVGDIGNGAIHKPDYKCPSGGAPLGNIAPAAGGPIAIEGSVCCPK